MLTTTASDDDNLLNTIKYAASFDLPFAFDMAMSYNVAGANLGFTYTSQILCYDDLKYWCFL